MITTTITVCFTVLAVVGAFIYLVDKHFTSARYLEQKLLNYLKEEADVLLSDVRTDIQAVKADIEKYKNDITQDTQKTLSKVVEVAADVKDKQERVVQAMAMNSSSRGALIDAMRRPGV